MNEIPSAFSSSSSVPNMLPLVSPTSGYPPPAPLSSHQVPLPSKVPIAEVIAREQHNTVEIYQFQKENHSLLYWFQYRIKVKLILPLSRLNERVTSINHSQILRLPEDIRTGNDVGDFDYNGPVVGFSSGNANLDSYGRGHGRNYGAYSGDYNRGYENSYGQGGRSDKVDDGGYIAGHNMSFGRSLSGVQGYGEGYWGVDGGGYRGGYTGGYGGRYGGEYGGEYGGGYRGGYRGGYEYRRDGSTFSHADGVNMEALVGVHKEVGYASSPVDNIPSQEQSQMSFHSEGTGSKATKGIPHSDTQKVPEPVVEGETEVLKKRKRNLPKPPNPAILKIRSKSHVPTTEEDFINEELAEFEHDRYADDEDDENADAEDEDADNNGEDVTLTSREYKRRLTTISHLPAHPVSPILAIPSSSKDQDTSNTSKASKEERGEKGLHVEAGYIKEHREDIITFATYVNKLLEKSFFLQDGWDANGRVNNFAHPCLEEVVKVLFYTSNKALAKTFPDDFKAEIRYCISKYKDGPKAKNINFTTASNLEYHKLYSDMIINMLREPYHASKFNVNMRSWAFSFSLEANLERGKTQTDHIDLS
ncbi:hypothetical protein F5876DRAFT_67748 [Lentinula aff. lateritia]|uniref:Uncharacterized protein n=1 Tax=Lentinula aff. lateritia TaxID=2804960 RepID=A0ACC1TU83_9AGAR|nr:hypothetical protein F5876DRAFT_67748 [Lentinula aff. lateritia]